MSDLKTAVIYYSATGTNYKMAQWAADSVTHEGGEVRLLKVQELAPAEAIESNANWKKHVDETKHIPVATLDDLQWAHVIIFSAPTRYGNLPAQMKQFLDSTGPIWAKGLLANKVVTGMTSAKNLHGGQEQTILSLYTTMYHWGAIVVTPGYTDPLLYAAGGNPYGASVSVDEHDQMREDVREAIQYQAKRALTIARWLHKGATNNEGIN